MNLNKLDRIVNSHYTVYSFDLFDTVFFRKYFSLEEVLYSSCRYLSGYLKGHSSINSLVEERKRLGQSLKHSLTLKTQEPKLVDILSSLVRNHEIVNDISIDELVSKTISFELSLECSNLQLNPQVLKVLKRLNNDGKHIICITDMYFDQEQILSIMDGLGIRRFFRDVFVSSEIGLTKQTGDLFTHVTNSLKIKPSDVLHIGDKLSSDFRSARIAGLDSKLVRFNRTLTPTFGKVEDIRNLVSLLSTAFLLDLIQNCHARKISKIFFLSRDATILGKICRSLGSTYDWVNKYFSDLSICDLDISRASTAFLELEWEEDRLEKIISLYLQNIGTRDLNAFLNYFDIPPLPTGSYDNALSINDWAKIIRTADAAYEECILKGAENKNQIVIKYLRQAGAIQSGDVAFVDIGYGGTIARRISNYLMRHITDRKAGPTRIHCFFLLSNNHLAANAQSAYPVARMNTPGFLNRVPIPGILRGNCVWLETFYQDKMRGPLLEYRNSKSGEITSIFSDMKNPEIATKSAMNTQLSRHITEQQLVLLASKFQSNSVIKGFLKEMCDPTQRTVEALKHYQYLTGKADQNCHRLVTHIAPSDLLPQNIKRLINNDYWLSGSARYSGYTWLNPILSPLLSVYYNGSQLATDFSRKLRYYLSKYGKPFIKLLLTQMGIVKAKQAP